MAQTLTKTVLLLTALVPLLVPFGLTRNVSMQAIVICLAGGLAWIAVLLDWKSVRLPRWVATALAIYILTCLLSMIVNPRLVNIFGTPLIRLGGVELLACVGIGLVLRQVTAQRLAIYLYVSIAVVAFCSIPYSLLHNHSWVRIGGLFYQPDFLAVVVAVGFVLGLYIWQHLQTRQWLVGITQLLLALVVLLTQTRAVIIILAGVTLLLCWLSPLSRGGKLLASAGVVLLIAGVVFVVLPSGNRLSNGGYAAGSVSYRYELQTVGLQHSVDRPLFGYGMGSLQQPLACQNLTARALRQTCHDGYYFDSSHDVFLDRWLALGWLGGASYSVLVIGLLIAALRQHRKVRHYGLAAGIIVAYYLTNIASLEIELLLWVCLLQAVNVTKITNSGNDIFDKHERLTV